MFLTSPYIDQAITLMDPRKGGLGAIPVELRPFPVSKIRNAWRFGQEKGRLLAALAEVRRPLYAGAGRSPPLARPG